jgi:ABC-type lipoprotein release transport system permease subunit
MKKRQNGERYKIKDWTKTTTAIMRWMQAQSHLLNLLTFNI